MKLTSESLERLKSYCSKGYSNLEIADLLEVSDRTVLRWKALAGVDKMRYTHLTPSQEEFALTLLEDGASVQEVARTLEVDWGVIDRRFPGHSWSKSESGSWGYFISGIK